MLTIRCSSLPLFFQCSQSAAPGIRVETGDREPADMGTAIHEVLSRWIKEGDGLDVFEAVDEVSFRLGLECEELLKQCYFAKSSWNGAVGYFPNPTIDGETLRYEDHERGLAITGTPDLYCSPAAVGALEVRVPDFKTGRAEGEHEYQLRGYGWLLLQKFPEAERVFVAEIRTREIVMTNGRYWTRRDLTHWWAGLADRIADQTYRVGRHCSYCPRGVTCEARTAWYRQAVEQFAALAPQHENAVSLPPERLAEMLERSRMVEKATKMAQEIVRAEVRSAGGIIRLPDGRVLKLKPTQQKQFVFPQALPVLREAIGDEVLETLYKVSKEDAEDAVKATVGRGQKKAVVTKMLEDLETAGALQIKVVERLEFEKAQPLIEEQKTTTLTEAAS